jgi:hypothetical protein
MFSKISIAAVFAVAIASSLMVVISSNFADSAYAFGDAERQYQQDINPSAVVSVPFSGLSAGLDEDDSRSKTSHILNPAGSDWTFGDDSGIITKYVNMWKEECNDA